MDDDLLLLKPLTQLMERMDHDVLFSYDRRVYKLAGGPGQVWTAFIAAKPVADVFVRAIANLYERRATQTFSTSAVVHRPSIAV